MPIPQSFYLNAPTLTSATAIFMDSNLTICAPDGYYSDGTIVREQVSCALLPESVCPSCCETDCIGWQVSVAALESANVEYLDCGNSIRELVAISLLEPQTFSICLKKNYTPKLISGNATFTITNNCGCCTENCQTWVVTSVVEPSVKFDYIECNGTPSEATVNSGDVPYFFCIQSNTLPVITEGNGDIVFYSCGCPS